MTLRIWAWLLLLSGVLRAGSHPNPLGAQTIPQSVLGYRDFSAEAKVEEEFLTVPDAKLAGEELKTLTAAPHLAATPED